MKAVVLGATRGLGRAVARELAARGQTVFLLGRDAAELEVSASDVRTRAGKVEATLPALVSAASAHR